MAVGYQSYPLLQNVKLTPPAPGTTLVGHPAAPPVSGSLPAFSLLTPQQIQATVAKYTSQLPQALTPAQIRQQASAEIQPQISALSKSLQTQVADASQAITGYTGSLANSLGGIDYAAPFTQGEGQQAAVDAALAQSLSGGGQQAAADLQARLAQIGEPGATGAAADAVKANAVGNANTVLGAGSSNLGQLIAEAASAKSYGQQLPGIAKLSGIQDIANLQGNAQQTLGTQTQAIESQLPTILNDLRASADTNATNRANLGEKLTEYLNSANASTEAAAVKQQQVAQQMYIEAKKLGLVADNQSFDQWYKTQQIGIDRTKANAPKIVGSGSTGYYTYDPHTGTVTRIVSPVAKPGAGSAATGGLTSSSWASLVKSATSSVADGLKTKAPGEHYVTPTAANGLKQGEWIPVPGSGTQAVPYATKLNEVLAMGPQTPAWQKKATAIVNAAYPMGENGRPYDGPQAVTVARQFAATALKAGDTYQVALQKGRATGLLPDTALIPALRTVYKRAGNLFNGAPVG